MFTCCVEYLLFLFFFKQKTAYEMRISDWSSDVCSSDLNGLAAHAVLSRAKLTKLTVWRAIALATERRGRTRVPQALTKGVARLIRRRVWQSARVEDRACTPCPQPLSTSVAWMTHPQQHGSTSCRGRGCQYVEI